MAQKVTRIWDRVLPLLVGAAGIWAVIYVVAGGDWSKMDESELARVEGCYTLAGQQLFRIRGRTLLTADAAVGFDGWHEKGRDALIVDRPVVLTRGPAFALVWQGTLTKIPIIYDDPMRLVFWDDGHRRWEASRANCPAES